MVERFGSRRSKSSNCLPAAVQYCTVAKYAERTPNASASKPPARFAMGSALWLPLTLIGVSRTAPSYHPYPHSMDDGSVAPTRERELRRVLCSVCATIKRSISQPRGGSYEFRRSFEGLEARAKHLNRVFRVLLLWLRFGPRSFYYIVRYVVPCLGVMPPLMLSPTPPYTSPHQL